MFQMYIFFTFAVCYVLSSISIRRRLSLVADFSFFSRSPIARRNVHGLSVFFFVNSFYANLDNKNKQTLLYILTTKENTRDNYFIGVNVRAWVRVCRYSYVYYIMENVN